MKDTFNASAYGGDGWSPRRRTHAQELGTVWVSCGMQNEWAPLKAVVLHRPGVELQIADTDPGAVQMLASLDLARAQDEHDQMVQAYIDNGVIVHYLESFDEVGPDVAGAGKLSPNQMFCADLFAMTPQGAILARPASTVRAGEERVMARRLADIGIPILKSLTGNATFEGADLIWINREQAVLGIGLRTNRAAAAQISSLLQEIGTHIQVVDMPVGTMHLMGMVRIVDHNLAIAWPRRAPHAMVVAMRESGYEVIFLPESDETAHHRAFNFVTLGPRKILMVAGNPRTRDFYQANGISCVHTPASELGKAAGAIGCLTGVLWRCQA